MRTLGFRTHVVLVALGAAGVLVALGRPWYDRAATAKPDSALYGLVDAVQRWLGAPGGTEGWDALGVSGQLLGGLAALMAMLALASIAPALQAAVREPLRYGSFAVLALAAWRLLDPPGPNAALEPRAGAFVGLLSAAVLWVSAQGVANAPVQRRRAPARAV